MRYLLTFIFFINLFASDFINIPLKDYISIVSRINKINIVLDEDIDNKITFLISKDLDKKTYLNVLKTLLDNKDMYLYKQKNFYIIKKKNLDPLDKKDFYSIKLNYIDFEDIENFLKIYEDKIKYEFIKSSKILFIKSSKSDYKSIKDIVSKIDTLPPQLKLKITVIDTNIDKIKEFGLDNSISLSKDSDSSLFFNLVAFPFSISSDISSSKKNKFYSFLNLINENGSSSFLSSPILTFTDNKLVDFSVGNNIPFSIGSTVISDDDSKTTTSIEYKDVGLQIKATPKIYDNNLVYIDLDLEISNIVSNINNLPITSKKHIKQSFYMNDKKIFVLTGINQNESSQTLKGVPFLMNIPYLGWLFKYESENKSSSNISIFFEIINEKETMQQLNIPLIKKTKSINMINHEKRVKKMLGL